MIRSIRNHVTRGEDFAFETKLAGRRYARAIPAWQAAGYCVGLIFLALPIVEVAISRVTERVSHGGHFVPESIIRRWFIAGRENFDRIYEPLVDEWWLYDNSTRTARLIEQGENP